MTIKSTHAQAKKTQQALQELFAEKNQAIQKVFEERDAALVKFAKEFVYKISVKGCNIKFARVEVSNV